MRQVNSKVLARLEVPVDIAENVPRELAPGAPEVTRALAGRAVRRVVAGAPEPISVVTV